MVENVIIVVILLGIVGGIIWYLRRAKKRGIKCPGGPSSGQCSGNCNSCNGSCGNVKSNEKSESQE